MDSADLFGSQASMVTTKQKQRATDKKDDNQDRLNATINRVMVQHRAERAKGGFPAGGHTKKLAATQAPKSQSFQPRPQVAGNKHPKKHSSKKAKKPHKDKPSGQGKLTSGARPAKQ